jgi:O-antigen ligase
MTGQTADKLDRYLFTFYLVFVFSSTFSRALAQMTLGCALAIFLMIVVIRKYQPYVKSLRWFYIFAALYVIWLLASAVVSKDPAHALYSCRKEWLFVAVPIGVYLFQTERYRVWTINALAIGVAIFSIYAVIEYLTGTHWLNFEGMALAPKKVSQITGPYFRPLTFADYYGTVALLLLGYVSGGTGKWSRRSWSLVISAALAIGAVALTGVRGPAIYVLIGLLFLALMKGRTVRWVVVGACVILAMVSLSLPGMRAKYAKMYEVESMGIHQGSRHFIWENSLALLSRSPIFGVGNGNFMPEYRSQVGPGVATEYVHGHAHNDILNSAVIGGIPCGIFFAGIWVVAFRYLWRGWRNSRLTAAERQVCFAALVGSLVYLLTSMTESTFAMEETHELIMIIWALGFSALYKCPEKMASQIA